MLEAEELHTFECNPDSFATCSRNHSKRLPVGTRGFLCSEALNDKEGSISFFPIDTEKTISCHLDGNPGASSMLRANNKFPREQYVQNQIKVKATTLDTYSRNHKVPELLWMDLQGAELLALKGGESVLQMVQIIHLEVGFRAMYENQAMFWDIDKYMQSKSFFLAHLDIGRWPHLPSLYSALRYGPWIGNAIYVSKSAGSRKVTS